jgi:transcriptional regulator with XRE-family HTH domain
MHLMHFHEKLRRLIAYRNLTQEELGKALNIAQTTVGRWLAGKSLPYDRTATRLADYFGIDDMVLLNDEFELPENSLVADYRGYKVTPELTKKMRRVHDEYRLPSAKEMSALSAQDGLALADELERTAIRLNDYAAAIRKRQAESKKKH